MRFASILNSAVLSFGVLLLAFGVLFHLNVPVGHFGDWVVGLVAAAWLLAVVVVPWNVHFRAKAVLADAGPTRERGLNVDVRQVAYVRRIAQLSLWIAIGLHVASAVALLVLAATGVTRVGYAASAVALLLTGLRPAASAYAYLAERLRAIGHSWRYPREDVAELRQRVEAVEASAKRFDLELDADRPESLVATQRAQTAQARQAAADLSAELAALRAANAVDHERLAREARSAVAQVTADGQFLDHVREILRFFKSA